MRRSLTALVAGLAAGGAIVAPAATGSVTAKASSCYNIQQYVTHKWATDIPDSLWLYFEPSEKTSYCLDSTGTPYYYRIRDSSTGNCLREDDSATDGDGHPEISEESCTPNYAWEQWYWGTADNGAVDYFENGYSEGSSTGLCLYDNTQEPAIDAPCGGVTDKFFWFLL
jgi:hypothetical protein